MTGFSEASDSMTIGHLSLDMTQPRSRTERGSGGAVRNLH